MYSKNSKNDQWYDSDGTIGPFYEAIELKCNQDYEEDTIPEEHISASSEEPTSTDPPPLSPLSITPEDIKKIKIPELKEELRK